MSAAQSARSVDFPYPASATTVVSLRSSDSPRSVTSRSRLSSEAGAAGGRSFVVAVAPDDAPEASVPGISSMVVIAAIEG